MHVRLKICGVTTPEGLEAAVRAGADAVGFVFSESPRQVSLERATELAAGLPAFVARVAVFHLPSLQTVQEVCDLFGPDLVQTEPEGLDGLRLPAGSGFLPVFHDADDLVARVDRYLADEQAPRTLLIEGAGRGGRGVSADWKRVSLVASRERVILAGGLTLENVGEAIRLVRPYGVDVSSGVERSPGVKDSAKVKAFAAAVRSAGLGLDQEERG